METRGETFVMKDEGADAAPLTFQALVMGLAGTALIHLGETPHPESGKVEVNPTLAKQNLDLLVILREKTKGNLTEDEERFFSAVLADLQLRFVQSLSTPK